MPCLSSELMCKVLFKDMMTFCFVFSPEALAACLFFHRSAFLNCFVVADAVRN